MTAKIKRHLGKDPVLKPLIAQVKLKERPAQNSVYEALLRAINFQQLSGKAASTIHGRFLELFDDYYPCLLYTSPSPRDATLSRMPSSA